MLGEGRGIGERTCHHSWYFWHFSRAQWRTSVHCLPHCDLSHGRREQYRDTPWACPYVSQCSSMSTGDWDLLQVPDMCQKRRKTHGLCGCGIRPVNFLLSACLFLSQLFLPSSSAHTPPTPHEDDQHAKCCCSQSHLAPAHRHGLGACVTWGAS